MEGTEQYEDKSIKRDKMSTGLAGMGYNAAIKANIIDLYGPTCKDDQDNF